MESRVPMPIAEQAVPSTSTHGEDAAYAAGLVLIWLLVVAQVRSYGVALIIMAPILLTIVGIMPGHALLVLPVVYYHWLKA